MELLAGTLDPRDRGVTTEKTARTVISRTVRFSSREKTLYDAVLRAELLSHETKQPWSSQ